MNTMQTDIPVLGAKFPTAPCPFCGDPTHIEASLRKDGWGGLTENGWYCVRCPGCGAQGPDMRSRGTAAYEWNRVHEH